MSEASNSELLARARSGDRNALGELLKGHNGLLERLAQREVGDRLQARLSAADLVQQTCLSAIRNFDDFNGENEPQFVAWLQGVHQRNIQDAVRRHAGAKKRAVSAQQSLDTEVPQSSAIHTPSQRVMLGESTSELLEVLTGLPEDQAEAVRLRYLEQLSLKEISSRMDRSEVSVASLLKRGLVGLRDRMRADPD